MTRQHARPPAARRDRIAWFSVAIVVGLVASAGAVLGYSAAGTPAPAAVHGPSLPAATVSTLGVPAVSASATTPPLSPASAGTVVETAFINYNASLPGNFPSSVWDWDAGKSVVDPVTGDLWIPEWSIAFAGIPLPRFAPALVYDPATNETQMVTNLTNTSAIAFDPINGDLYATDPVDNTTVVFDPTTQTVVGAPIPVGIDPMAILFDDRSQNLYVANEVSDNVTVINGTTSEVQDSGVPAGTDPVALADDTDDGTLYVADGGADTVSTITISSNTAGTTLPVTGHPSTIGYSASADLLAIGLPGPGLLSMYNASTQAFFGDSAIHNVTSIVANATGSEFVVANGTAPDLFLVQASAGVVVPTLLPTPTVPTRLALSPLNGLVYAWSALGRSVSEVNLTTVEPHQTSPDLGAEAETLAFDPDSDHVFVADWRTDTVSVLNASTLGLARPPIPLPGTPTSLVDDSNSGTVYVAYVGGVAGIDAQTGVVTERNVALTGNNTQLVLNPAANLLWLLNKNVGLEALSIPGLTLAVVTHIAVGTGNLRGIALDPADNELFVANLTSSSVEVVNASTGSVIDAAIGPIAGLVSVAYDSADQMVYALGTAVWILDPVTNSIVAGPIPIAPHVTAWSIVYDPSREFLYVTSVDKILLPPYPGNLTVIDGSSVSASQGAYVTIPAGQLPIDIQPVQLSGSSAPDSDEIWVTNFVSGTLSVLASPPEITYLAATPNPVDVGASTSVTLQYEGGAGPSKVSYTGLPPACASSDTLELYCAPSSGGVYTISAQVEDSLGSVATATTTLSVSPPVRVEVELNWSAPGEIDVGDELGADAVVLGGTYEYNYTWAFGDGATAWGADVSHTYATVGEFPLTVTVSDAGGGVTSNTTEVVVTPLPTVSVAASPSTSTDVDRPVNLSASVNGGTTPGTGFWSFGDGTFSNNSSTSHAYAVAGVYFAAYHYEDASGASASEFLSIVVNPKLTAEMSVNTVPPGATPSTGALLNFNTTISGGTAPFTEVWGFDDGSYGYGVAVQHTYAGAGTYMVTLFVEDADGAEWNSTFSLVVHAAASTSGSSLSFDSGLVLGLLVGAAVAALVLFLAVRPPKRSPPSPPTAYVPPAAPAEAPAWKES